MGDSATEEICLAWTHALKVNRGPLEGTINVIILHISIATAADQEILILKNQIKRQ